MLSPRKHHLPKCDIVAKQEFENGSFVEIGEDGLAEIQFRREDGKDMLVAAIVSFSWFASDEVSLHDPKKHGQILLTMTDLTRIYSLCESVGIHLDKVLYYVVVNLLSDTVSIKHNVSLQKELTMADKYLLLHGRVVTLETLRRRCTMQQLPDGYAQLVWRRYWNHKAQGLDCTGAELEMVRIIFSESEIKTLNEKKENEHGK